MTQRLRATWLVSDDYDGGVVAVAGACCAAAARSGAVDATLLFLRPPERTVAEPGGARVASLDLAPPLLDAPQRLASWLAENPQDILVYNGSEEVDHTPPHLPAQTLAIYAVHDTAPRYFEAALHHEAALDAIVAISETVAACFRPRLSDPSKLRVIPNGSAFPIPLEALGRSGRADDLMFLGGDKPLKGAHDVLALWPRLTARGFAGRLHWFGDVGPALRHRVEALEGADRIELYGRVDRSVIFRTAARSKLILMLSRVEPFGMATLECMGMGCGVVAWDIETGTKEIATAPRDGRFAPLGDVARLAAAVLETLALTDDERAAIAQLARRSFSDEAMWRRYGELFETLRAAGPVTRPLAGTMPPPFTPKVRLFQMLPPGVRQVIRGVVGRSPTLTHALRDVRGR
ncbi:glycosyltransferase family 4 protein [Acuticoccus sp.]|uniref:glycosyltransferase family 4 protein n=1 Tax=Acuticoccus sp. TaxID=1904378 RepID=UPI003B52BB9B